MSRDLKLFLQVINQLGSAGPWWIDSNEFSKNLFAAQSTVGKSEAIEPTWMFPDKRRILVNKVKDLRIRTKDGWIQLFHAQYWCNLAYSPIPISVLLFVSSMPQAAVAVVIVCPFWRCGESQGYSCFLKLYLKYDHYQINILRMGLNRLFFKLFMVFMVIPTKAITGNGN